MNSWLRSHAQWVMFVFRMPIAWVKILDHWKSHTLKLMSPFRKPVHRRTSSLAKILSMCLQYVLAESQVSESKNSLTNFIGRIDGSFNCSRNWTYDWLLQIFSSLIYGQGKRERGFKNYQSHSPNQNWREGLNPGLLPLLAALVFIDVCLCLHWRGHRYNQLFLFST